MSATVAIGRGGRATDAVNYCTGAVPDWKHFLQADFFFAAHGTGPDRKQARVLRAHRWLAALRPV